MELAFHPDPGAREPVYRQLAGHLQALIEGGHLAPGQQLPPSRALAASLGVSRNTVNGAYSLLADGEWITSHVGRGTFVAARPPAATRCHRVPAGRNRTDARSGQGAGPGPNWDALFAQRAARLDRPRVLDMRASVRFDFRAGQADPSGLPLRALRRCIGRALEEDLPHFANASDARGWGPLREAIAARLVARGILCEPADVLVTSGAQQGLDLVARALLEAGDTVAVERPGYFGAEWVFRRAGAHLLPIPVDGQGLCVDELERQSALRPAKLVYCTPAVQAPTGVTLCASRRATLLRLAETHGIPVVEDDYDGDMRLDEPIVPALKTRDEAGHVITIGTFSKAVFPTLRLGYVVGARPLMQRLTELKLSSDMGTSHLEQAALARWIGSGGLDRHVRTTRRQVGERIDAALDAIAHELPAGTHVRRPAGGHALWVRLPEALEPSALRAEAVAADLAWSPTDAFLPGPEGDRYLMLSVAVLPPGEVREGIARLGQAVRNVQAGARAGASQASQR